MSHFNMIELPTAILLSFLLGIIILGINCKFKCPRNIISYWSFILQSFWLSVYSSFIAFVEAKKMKQQTLPLRIEISLPEISTEDFTRFPTIVCRLTSSYEHSRRSNRSTVRNRNFHGDEWWLFSFRIPKRFWRLKLQSQRWKTKWPENWIQSAPTHFDFSRTLEINSFTLNKIESSSHEHFYLSLKIDFNHF